MTVDIPDQVIAIGEDAFGNNLLTNVTIPSSVQEIGYNAFWNNKLTSVTISNDCQLGANAFDGKVIINRE